MGLEAKNYETVSNFLSPFFVQEDFKNNKLFSYSLVKLQGWSH